MVGATRRQGVRHYHSLPWVWVLHIVFRPFTRVVETADIYHVPHALMGHKALPKQNESRLLKHVIHELAHSMSKSMLITVVPLLWLWIMSFLNKCEDNHIPAP